MLTLRRDALSHAQWQWQWQWQRHFFGLVDIDIALQCGTVNSLESSFADGGKKKEKERDSFARLRFRFRFFGVSRVSKSCVSAGKKRKGEAKHNRAWLSGCQVVVNVRIFWSSL